MFRVEVLGLGFEALGGLGLISYNNLGRVQGVGLISYNSLGSV